MVGFVKQRRGIVLSVDVDELNAKFSQNGHGDKTAVDPADVLAVQVDFPLNDRLGIVFHAIVGKPVQFRHIGEHRPDGSLSRSGADHVPVCPFTENRGNGIDDNGFARAGLAGEDGKALVKGNVRALNNRDIFNMQKAQHGNPSPQPLVRPLISPQKAAAALVSRMMTTTVSSPARVPSTTLIFMASTAEAAAFARPGSV